MAVWKVVLKAELLVARKDDATADTKDIYSVA